MSQSVKMLASRVNLVFLNPSSAMSAANPVSAPPTAAVGHLPVALWLLTTTVANRDDARRLAGLVLQQALAACVQIQQIESHYRWDGALQR